MKQLQYKMRSTGFSSMGVGVIWLLVLCAGGCELSFEGFLGKFRKSYSPDERAYRSTLFQTACDRIDQLARDPASTYTLRLSFCSDLTETECLDYHNLRQLDLGQLELEQASQEGLRVGSPFVSAAAPSSLDYRNLGFVSSVKDQGRCASCFAFAAVGTYESWLLMRGFDFGLSEEDLLECASLYAPGRRQSNCTGGYIDDSLSYLAKVGGVLRSKYPYISGNISSGHSGSTPGICSETHRIYLGNGTVSLQRTLTAAEIRQRLVDSGPLLVGLYANYEFSLYAGGVYSGCPANAASYINHAVELIGYDASGNWIVKNQWGTAWGVSGFMTISGTLDCGLGKTVILLDFASYSGAPQQTFDPTVYQTPATAHTPFAALSFLALALLFLF